MSIDTHTRPHQVGRSPRRWVPEIAASALLIAGGAIWSIAGHDAQSPVTAPSPASSPSVAALSIGGAGAGMCFPVQVADLRRMQAAFEGTVSSISGELITLQVRHWYRGGSAGTVEVRSDVDAVTTLLGVDFKVGSSYLISAMDGQVSVCGESALVSPELQNLYEQAFPG